MPNADHSKPQKKRYSHSFELHCPICGDITEKKNLRTANIQGPYSQTILQKGHQESCLTRIFFYI